MSVTFYNSGRMGNIAFITGMVLAYCKKYDLDYYIPELAVAYREHAGHVKNPFAYIPSTGKKPINPRHFQESNIHTNPSYQEIPKFDFDVQFDGYFQSFLYFDWCRDYILEKFNLPQKRIDVTSISTRRTDCLGSPNFPILPLEYYKNAVRYMQEKGFNKFRIFGDDQRWNRKHFSKENFPDAEFEFSENTTEMQDYIDLQNCTNNITARSTFSLTAAWMNQNPNKIVLVPDSSKFHWWKGQNLNMLDGTNFIPIDVVKKEDLELERIY